MTTTTLQGPAMSGGVLTSTGQGSRRSSGRFRRGRPQYHSLGCGVGHLSGSACRPNGEHAHCPNCAAQQKLTIKDSTLPHSCGVRLSLHVTQGPIRRAYQTSSRLQEAAIQSSVTADYILAAHCRYGCCLTLKRQGTL